MRAGPERDEAFKKERARWMRSLARRSRSVEEVRQKMARRDIEAGLIDDLIENLLSHSFLDDRRFAGEFTRSRLRTGYGPVRIRRELKEKGVDDQHVESAISEELVDLSEEDVLGEVLQNRLRIKGEPEEPGELKNLLAFLARRGFSHDLVKQKLARYYERVFERY